MYKNELVTYRFELSEFNTSDLEQGQELSVTTRKEDIEVKFEFKKNTLGEILVRKLVTATIQKVRKSPLSGTSRLTIATIVNEVDQVMVLVGSVIFKKGQQNGEFRISSTYINDDDTVEEFEDTLGFGEVLTIFLTKKISKGELEIYLESQK
jgi:hypothetical protein